ncbi:hypothetical protein ACHAXT_011035 [Thalassiosira profunda]
MMDSVSVDEAVPASTEAAPMTKEEGGAAKPPITHKHWINLVSYVANITLVYGVGNAGWLGTPDNGELSDKYQSLVTPNSGAFLIWAVIFLAQGLFALLQFLPRFRASPMLLKGVNYWYPVVAATQIGWTFAFAYEVIWLSLTFMLLIWASLIGLLYAQYFTESDTSIWEFWALRFPFAIHAGWITAASALNVNVQVVAADAAADIQLAVAIVSLAVLHAISVWVLFQIRRPNWTIAGVLSWAFGYIYVELGNPNEKITSTFAQQTIDGVRYAAIAVSFIIVAQFVLRLVMLARPKWNPYRKAITEDHSAEETVGIVKGSDDHELYDATAEADQVNENSNV